MVMIVLLSLFSGVGTLMGIQPFSGIIGLGNGISKSWDRNEEGALAAPSGERTSLAEHSSRQELEDEGETYERIEKRDRMEEHEAGFGYRHRYHRNHEEISGISGSRELAFLPKEINADTVTPFGSADKAGISSINSRETPDDELHRQTRRSCSSCH